MQINELDREELVQELFVRSYRKNYHHEGLLKDDLDYIVSCIKASIGNYHTLKYKEWDKQCSANSAFSKRLRYGDEFLKHRGLDYNEFTEVVYGMNEIISQYKPKYKKKDYQSVVKFFARCLCDKNLMKEFDYPGYDYLKMHMNLYIKVYVECLRKANRNILSQKEVICNILNKALDNVDWTLDNKQIVKFINQRIRWEFLNLTHKLPTYYEFKVKRYKQNSAKDTIKNTRKHILNKWFNLNNITDDEILELEFINKNQKIFIIDVLKNIDVEFHKNKEGKWDINKTQVASKLGITYDALCKRVSRIKSNSILAGMNIELEKYEEMDYVHYPKTRKEMFDSLGMSEEAIESLRMGKEQWEEEQDGYWINSFNGY